MANFRRCVDRFIRDVTAFFSGRIAGISGIVWGAISIRRSGDTDTLWRWLFIAGILLGAFLFHLLSGKPAPEANANYLLAAIAGLFVGLGVKIGNGCTSGHGVCGIGRLSTRSLAATITFMAVAVITVAIFNAVFGAGGTA
ncbi:MAG: putative membrane protein YedE/YeeE [Cryomorphaceae bacterium]|jgi:uncharacterized membrane protein YedE/YeeE